MNIDELSENIVFKKEIQIFYDIVNKGIKENYFSNDLSFTSDILFFKNYYKKFNHDENDFDEFLKTKDTLYWFTFFEYILKYYSLFEEFFTLFKENDYDEIKKLNFLNYLISMNLKKVFLLYEEADEEPPLKNFYLNNDNEFSKLMKKYINKNFEKLHETFGGFLFLMQNIESSLIENIIPLYETHEMFSKYFNTYNKIEKNNYKNFLKFWFYLIKYQKIPTIYINKYLINFENNNVLKIALNRAKYYKHYWSKIEENRSIFKKLHLENYQIPHF